MFNARHGKREPGARVRGTHGPRGRLQTKRTHRHCFASRLGLVPVVLCRVVKQEAEVPVQRPRKRAVKGRAVVYSTCERGGGWESQLLIVVRAAEKPNSREGAWPGRRAPWLSPSGSTLTQRAHTAVAFPPIRDNREKEGVPLKQPKQAPASRPHGEEGQDQEQDYVTMSLGPGNAAFLHKKY